MSSTRQRRTQIKDRSPDEMNIAMRDVVDKHVKAYPFTTQFMTITPNLETKFTQSEIEAYEAEGYGGRLEELQDMVCIDGYSIVVRGYCGVHTLSVDIVQLVEMDVVDVDEVTLGVKDISLEDKQEEKDDESDEKDDDAPEKDDEPDEE